MNNLKLDGLRISGKGIVTSSRSPLEKMAAEEENEGGIERTSNEAIPATEIVLDKHDVSEPLTEEPEGYVEKTVVKPTDTLELKTSAKRGFDPSAVSNALREDDNEGGIIANRMAITQKAEGSLLRVSGTNKDEIDSENMYEVTGFSIQYEPEEGKGIVSEEVRDFYDSLEEAVRRFKKDIYRRPDDILATISRGAPIICVEERQVGEYINDAWRGSKKLFK